MKRIRLLILLGAGALTPFLAGCAAVTREEKAAFASNSRAAAIIGQEDGGADLEEQAVPLGEGSTLSDYLVYAIKHNAGLKSAFNKWQAALEKIPQVRAAPDPRLSYGYYIQEVETRVGPQRHRFGLAQMFPWFGKLGLRGAAALEAAKAEEQRFEATRLKLFFRVRKAYYDYYYLSRAIEVTRENMELLKYLETVARARHKAGGGLANVLQLQVELGKLEDRLRAMEDSRHPMVARLNAALNRPPNAPLPEPKDIEGASASFTDDQARDWLAADNPDLKALEFLAGKERRAVELARKEFFPDITLGAQWIETDGAIMSGVADNGKDPLVATISVNLPIRRGKYRAGVRESRARLQSVVRQREDKANLLYSDLEMALYGFRDAERKIDLYRDTLTPKARQSLEVTIQGFEAGKVDFLNLIDAERILLEFELAHERARADRAQRLAEIEMLTGREILTPASKSAPSEAQKGATP